MRRKWKSLIGKTPLKECNLTLTLTISYLNGSLSPLYSNSKRNPKCTLTLTINYINYLNGYLCPLYSYSTRNLKCKINFYFNINFPSKSTRILFWTYRAFHNNNILPHDENAKFYHIKLLLKKDLISEGF